MDNVVDSNYIICNCSNKHVPKTHKLVKLVVNEVDIYLCPTSYYNLVSLREKWKSCDGEPPGSVRKHYSVFVQRLAKEMEMS